jgi:hypothetical protein
MALNASVNAVLLLRLVIAHGPRRLRAVKLSMMEVSASPNAVQVPAEVLLVEDQPPAAQLEVAQPEEVLLVEEVPATQLIVLLPMISLVQMQIFTMEGGVFEEEVMRRPRLLTI